MASFKETVDGEIPKRGSICRVSQTPPDEIKVVQSPDSPEWITAQKRYMRKLNLIILPAISLLYFFEYLDRGNIANAKLYGFDAGHDTPRNGIGPGKESLGSTEWQLTIMIFYVGLLLAQVPGCIGYRIFPPSKWIALGVCGWSVASLLQCLASNLGQALACRVFLGVFEGLFGTGILYYLSLWYHRTELGVRVFWFLGPTAIAGAFGGLLAFAIGHVDSPTPAWKWLFVVEALPCFCLGVFCLYWLPDRPLRNSRFRGVDQAVAEMRYGAEEVDQETRLTRRHFVMALTDWKVYAQAGIYLPTAALLSSISGFLPTIVAGLGYNTPTSANLMTIPPYAVAFLLMYLTSWSSDRRRERGLHIAALMTLAAMAYLLLALLPDSALRAKYAAVCLAVPCVYATFPPTHAWAANNLGSETKRAVGLGAYTALGNLGSVGGAWMYPASTAPGFRVGHLACVGLAVAAAAGSLGNKWVLGRVNRARDEREGRPGGLMVDVTDEGDESVGFRYIT